MTAMRDRLTRHEPTRQVTSSRPQGAFRRTRAPLEVAAFLALLAGCSNTAAPAAPNCTALQECCGSVAFSVAADYCGETSDETECFSALDSLHENGWCSDIDSVAPAGDAGDNAACGTLADCCATLSPATPEEAECTSTLQQGSDVACQGEVSVLESSGYCLGGGQTNINPTNEGAPDSGVMASDGEPISAGQTCNIPSANACLILKEGSSTCEGGTVGTTCPTASLVGCCTLSSGALTAEACYYGVSILPDGTESTCSASGGSWTSGQ